MCVGLDNLFFIVMKDLNLKLIKILISEYIYEVFIYWDENGNFNNKNVFCFYEMFFFEKFSVFEKIIKFINYFINVYIK